MNHNMNLNQEPFELIAKGLKTIELRLLDEKRQGIKIGDTITFTNLSNADEQVRCKVKGLFTFENFTELYNSLPLDKCGYMPDEIKTASPKDMELYYSTEKQAKHGVVGIEIELI